MLVAYDRVAFYLRENHNIRLTLDFNLRSRTEDLDLYLGDAGKRFFENNMCILEIKSCEAIPIWFANILNSLKIYPTSFSKYGEISSIVNNVGNTSNNFGPGNMKNGPFNGRQR